MICISRNTEDEKIKILHLTLHLQVTDINLILKQLQYWILVPFNGKGNLIKSTTLLIATFLFFKSYV